jgi:DNA-directed RNA polymerase specialized sigma24 family protein
MNPYASNYPHHQPQKKLLPQQVAILKAFAQATESPSPHCQHEAWEALKKWVSRRLYPWLTQYAPIAEELAQEGLITLWLALKNNPLEPTENATIQLAYYWRMVSALEQKARSLSQKEIRHWNRYANIQCEGADTPAWEEQVYFHSQQLQTNQALKVLDAEVGDVAQCIKQLFSQLAKRASLGEKALWFLKKRFHLEGAPSVAGLPTEEDASIQKSIAQTWGVSQQAVSGYEKRLLKQCQRWLMPYYPF